MTYMNNEKKLVVVLNGRIAIPQLMNAAGHVVSGLAATLGRDMLAMEDYSNAADGFSAKISRYPVIVAKAKNSSQLSTLRKGADEVGLPVNVFVSAMVGSSSCEQRTRTFAACGEDLVYWAVGVFGDAALVDPFTRKFSLFNVVDVGSRHGTS